MHRVASFFVVLAGPVMGQASGLKTLTVGQHLSVASKADGAVVSSSGLGGVSDNSILSVIIVGAEKKNYQHSDALFGIPPYGGGITGRLYYPVSHDPSGCNVANLTSDPGIPPQSIFLLDRGGCTFTQKVLAAQAAGAIGVVLIDNLGLCGRSPECGREACSRCPLYSTETCQCTLPYLGDDTGGAGITVPSMLIGREDGATLLEPASVSKSGPPHALVNMRWDMPTPDDKVDWMLWHSPNDPLTQKFRQSITPYLPYILPRTAFFPEPYIFDGRALGCGGPSPVFDCKDQCVNGGYYCAIDPDGDLDKGVSGADVVLESVRSMCVAAHAVQESDGGMKWWAYSDRFQAACGTVDTWTQTCSYRVMGEVGLDVEAVKACVAAGNATVDPGKGDYTNVLLQSAINARADMGIVTLPTVIVNGIVLRGGTQPAAVMGAMCAGYASGTSPPVCNCLAVPLEGLATCVATASGASTPNPTSLPTWAGVLIAFAVIGTLVALAASIYHHTQARRMSADMVELMDDYRALVDEGQAGEPTGTTGVQGGRRVKANRMSRERLTAGQPTRSSPMLPGWMNDAVRRIMAPPAASGSDTFATSSSGLPTAQGNAAV